VHVTPRATYRLQLHDGFTFWDAAAIVPYLAALGVSHLYLSPIMRAGPGSLHGYDVLDHSTISPALGGDAGLDALVAATRADGLGIVLDVVPNHMSILYGNAWWWDVLEHGRRSSFARAFDIGWDGPEAKLHDQVLLPILADQYGREVDRGAIRRAAAAFRGRRGDDVSVNVVPGTLAGLASIESLAPAALLVRPDGSIWIHSVQPFAFGRVPDDSLAECWQRIVRGWRDPRIADWAGAIRSRDDMPRSGLAPYRDPALDVTSTASLPSRGDTHPEPPPDLPERTQGLGAGSPAAARAQALELVRERRYARAPMRAVEEVGGGLYVRVLEGGRVFRLNAQAALVLDACTAGTLADAGLALEARFPGLDPARALDDVLMCIRMLEARGALVPYESPSATSSRSANADTNAEASAVARTASIP
jgi:hypothetical protein